MGWITLAESAQPAAKLFGYTLGEWAVLLTALAAVIEAVRSKVGKAREGRKVRAAIQGLDDAAEAHPEAVRLAKLMIRDKATKMGVETGSLLFPGLHDDVEHEKKTRRLERLEEDGETDA